MRCVALRCAAGGYRAHPRAVLPLLEFREGPGRGGGGGGPEEARELAAAVAERSRVPGRLEELPLRGGGGGVDDGLLRGERVEARQQRALERQPVHCPTQQGASAGRRKSEASGPASQGRRKKKEEKKKKG